MEQLKIPEMKSSYIPVGSTMYARRGMHWWKNDSPFKYPFLLLNLEEMTSCEATKEELGIPEDVNFATDSGGFQVIRGTCKMDWKESIEKQIRLGANMLFSFDTPPVRRMDNSGDNNFFEELPVDEYYKLVKSNFDVACEQSDWLKKNHPEKVKQFYYVLHSCDKRSLDYNLQLMEEKFGSVANYKEHFGGVCYSIKKSDIFFFATTIIHANNYFIKNGVRVHFLGIGAVAKFIYLVKGKVTTFDSSNAISGIMRNQYFYPVNKRLGGSNVVTTSNKYYEYLPCFCPACRAGDSLFKEWKEVKTDVCVNFSLHNLYRLLQEVYFLNSLKDENYNEIVSDCYGLEPEKKLILEYIDYYFKNGFEQAYEKFKHRVPDAHPQMVKQGGIFDF